MAVKTQGTHLYYVDTLPTAPVLVKLKCPTGISGLGGAADQIDTTCLDDTEDRQFERGLGSPGQVSVPFVLDPQNASHQGLFALKASGKTLDWLVCLADGTAPPTLSGGTMTPPTTRSSLGFVAYVADLAIEVATNEVVRGTLTLQRSGTITPRWKA